MDGMTQAKMEREIADIEEMEAARRFGPPVPQHILEAQNAAQRVIEQRYYDMERARWPRW